MEYNSQPSGNAKTVAMLSYFTIVGWIIALILHNSDRSELGAFHLRQGIGLILCFIIISFIPFLRLFLYIGVLILWVLGLITAVNGEQKPIPIFGEFFQRTFAGLK
jgi:uncharacterized membrane protein